MRVLVVGAGIVGLCCAWYLQEHSVDVAVLDRARVGAGASWGNAGYVSPAHATPLPEPAMLRSGLRALVDPRAPVAVPLRGDRARARFLVGLLRHCTDARWHRSMRAYLPLNESALAAHQELADGGVRARCVSADMLVAFGSARQARGELDELSRMAASGQRIDVDLLTGDQARELEPALSSRIGCGVLVRGQCYIHPPDYLAALASAVRERGAIITEGASVHTVRRVGDQVLASTRAGEHIEADAVVLANGAWLGRLAAPHGVRMPVHAGRGYSFSLPTSAPLTRPVRLPSARLALTPYGEGRIRVAGMMEFADPDEPLAPRRIRSMAEALAPLLNGLDWAGRRQDWVGARPLSTDGVPLVGRTATRGVYVAGGHGMWGITLGPVTGRLLAASIVTGRTPPELAPLNPLR